MQATSTAVEFQVRARPSSLLLSLRSVNCSQFMCCCSLLCPSGYQWLCSALLCPLIPYLQSTREKSSTSEHGPGSATFNKNRIAPQLMLWHTCGHKGRTKMKTQHPKLDMASDWPDSHWIVTFGPVTGRGQRSLRKVAVPEGQARYACQLDHIVCKLRQATSIKGSQDLHSCLMILILPSACKSKCTSSVGHPTP